MEGMGTERSRDRDILKVGGVSARTLAKEYGTPLYIMDEAALREAARGFQRNFQHPFLETEVLYASKAFMTRAMAQLVQEEGLSLDVVSGGELYTALSAGFDPRHIYFHGNNKSKEEIAYAISSGVGTVILDNEDELERVQGLLRGTELRLRVMLRVNPGIEAHTHEYISTTKNDSKFGLSVFAEETKGVIHKLDKDPNLQFLGLHCHIGSQIFEGSSFLKEGEALLDYVAILKEEGISVQALNLGGGFGVRYVEGDAPLRLSEFFPSFLDGIYKKAQVLGLLPLKLMIEPGRAIAANAGMTLYTVGGTKRTYGGKDYVFVDGSMADHIRTVLYDAEYEAVAATRMQENATQAYTVTGKACESGDILIRRALLPKMEKGDLLAILSTGAYHYSMASNYNRLPRPGVVFVKEGKSRLVVRRETYADLVRNDLSLEGETHDGSR